MTEEPKKPAKQWEVPIPTTAQGLGVMAGGLGLALRATIEQLRKSAPDKMEEARAAAVLAIKTSITERISIDDEAPGYRAAIETTNAMFDAELGILHGDDPA